MKVLCAVILAALVGGCAYTTRGPELPVGVPAPDFTLPNHLGGTTSLSELTADGPAVILFFSTFRGRHKRSRFGELGRAADDIRATGARIAAIAVDGALALRDVAASERVSFPLLSDEWLKVSLAYGVAMEGEARPVPAVFIVRQDGTVAWKYVAASFSDRPSADQVLEVLRSLGAGSDHEHGAPRRSERVGLSR